ncbi:PSD1 and planctomycete cytochrome C domain-containing protein [Luteolibacter algae]|uniref:PSD1 and planctomycete cytochrome C domain-containing protein n=1 Tax=Luteolibacter algae TaxID=454151 RepID=A0ABW5D680_9BACT
MGSLSIFSYSTKSQTVVSPGTPDKKPQEPLATMLPTSFHTLRSRSIPQLCWILLGAFPAASALGGIGFNEEIRPIISKNCIGCHGPDDGDRKADFRIDTFEGATYDNDGVIGIVPGDAEASEVFKRIATADPDDVMPPPEHGHALSVDEIETIRQWINEGARYETHWSFVKPTKSSVPTAGGAWARNEIDGFIAEKHAKLGLSHSPQADAYELLRRVSLDLTGIPPTYNQAQAFAADPSLENYEKQVDALLSSPHFGEHWAAMWLDLARYADSVGYSGDEHRDIWPWRDWVINAFNKNMPFDQFTIEQLAGDLLPDPTPDQILATAFNRNTLSNNEGGTNDEEFRVIAVKDRINTTVNVWMGLTMRCAECHTHKYDPIRHEEYYSFYDLFNQTEDNDRKDDKPKLEIRPRGREKEISQALAEIKKLEAKRPELPDPWIVPAQAGKSRDGAKLKTLPDQSIEASGKNPLHDEYTTTFKAKAGKLTGIRLELLPSQANGESIGRTPDGATLITKVSMFLKSGESLTPVMFSDAAAEYIHPNLKITNLIDGVDDDKVRFGWGVNHPREGYRSRREGVFSLAEPLDLAEDSELVFVINHDSPYTTLNTARYRISYTSAPQPADQYRKNTLDPNERKIRELAKKAGEPIRVPIMAELPQNRKRESHIMIRGSFMQPGEKVNAAVLGSFNPLPEGAPLNRLGVAKWLVDPENPLTARVTVNRFWARIFGYGIVETEEDFGMQGLPPTHPKLLDWLAVDFIESGWDTKAILKKMVMSATYRQSSVASEAQLELDPRNLFLSHGPRVRLPAEVVRDQALAVSGLLTDRQFGKPVYPPSPVKRIASAFTGGMTWVENTDDDRYRRAIYTYLKRTSPHPLFDTFDMASRDVCNLRRLRTNTPLQSFMTLNDAVFIEAAQSLARKMLLHSPQAPAEAISHGLELAMNTPAAAAQIPPLLALYEDSLANYQADAKAAMAMAGENKIPSDLKVTETNAAQLAALSVVANVILNLDGFLTN